MPWFPYTIKRPKRASRKNKVRGVFNESLMKIVPRLLVKPCGRNLIINNPAAIGRDIKKKPWGDSGGILNGIS